MDVARLGKSVRRVTVLQKDASGGTTPITIYERKASRKKGTRALKPGERAVRQWVDGQARAARSYLDRHKKSNSKRKDGWLRDYGVNVVRASRKGSKAIKANRLFSY